MKTFIFSLFFILTSHSTIHAQTYLSFSEKLINADFSVFHPLVSRGFPEMNEGIVQIRAGVKMDKKRWGFNSHISYFVSSDQNDKEKKNAKLDGYGLSLGAHYDLLSWGTFNVQPRLEVGVRKYYLDYVETITKVNPITFRSISEHVTVFSFQGIGVFGDIGIALEKKYDGYNRSFGIGFGAGYRIDYGTWQLSDPIPIKNADAYNNGMFASISFFVALKRNAKKK